MRLVFADTGYWIALLYPRDDLHEKAIELSKRIQPAHIVTSEMVLVEVLNDVSKRGEYFRVKAVALIKRLKESPNIVIIPQMGRSFEAAFSLYQKRTDKDWSLTDCLSFVLMNEYGIVEALAYDKHFVQAGFVALLRDP